MNSVSAPFYRSVPPSEERQAESQLVIATRDEEKKEWARARAEEEWKNQEARAGKGSASSNQTALSGLPIVSPNTGHTWTSTSTTADKVANLIVLNHEEDPTKSLEKKKSKSNPDDNPEEDRILRAKYAREAANKRIKDKKEAAKEADRLIALMQAEAQLATTK